MPKNQAKLDLAGPVPWSQSPSKTAAGTQNAPLVKGWGEGQIKLQLSRQAPLAERPTWPTSGPLRARISKKEWEEEASALRALSSNLLASSCGRTASRAVLFEATASREEPPASHCHLRRLAAADHPTTALCAVPCGRSVRRYHRVWPLDLLYSLALSET